MKHRAGARSTRGAAKRRHSLPKAAAAPEPSGSPSSTVPEPFPSQPSRFSMRLSPALASRDRASEPSSWSALGAEAAHGGTDTLERPAFLRPRLQGSPVPSVPASGALGERLARVYRTGATPFASLPDAQRERMVEQLERRWRRE
ncbi:MAG TPA: hypothetical protein VGN26_04860 [Armatimonadota bacterium]